MNDFITNKLKALSVTELETIIAKAITDATGEEFNATVSKIDYLNEIETSLKINVSMKLNFPNK